MSEYEKWRIVLSIFQIIVTLGSPFVLIYVNNKLNKE